MALREVAAAGHRPAAVTQPSETSGTQTTDGVQNPPPGERRMPTLTRWTLAAAATLVVSLPFAPAPRDPPDLTGLWAARVRFGPDIRGPLTLLRGDSGWRADIAGFSVSGPRRWSGSIVRATGRERELSWQGERAGYRRPLGRAEDPEQWPCLCDARRAQAGRPESLAGRRDSSRRLFHLLHAGHAAGRRHLRRVPAQSRNAIRAYSFPCRASS